MAHEVPCPGCGEKLCWIQRAWDFCPWCGISLPVEIQTDLDSSPGESSAGALVSPLEALVAFAHGLDEDPGGGEKVTGDDQVHVPGEEMNLDEGQGSRAGEKDPAVTESRQDSESDPKRPNSGYYDRFGRFWGAH